MFKSENYKKHLNFIYQFHKYSANNIQLIKLQFPTASRVASFKDWKALGRTVKKGEKGIQILIPAPYKYFKDDNNKTIFLNQATDEQKEKIDKGLIKLKTGISFKFGYVFDVSQTEGAELPTLCKALKGEDEQAKAVYNALKRVYEIPIKYENTKGAKGYYNKIDNFIALNINNELNQNAKTLVHEYAHYKIHKQTDKDRNTKEVEAESVAYIVNKYFNFDTSEYSFGYIAGWSKSKELKELKASAETIQKTSK